MIFSTLNPPMKDKTPSGNEFLNVYQEEINKKGEKQLVKTGETNIYEMIQADLESTKIENILHAVAMGDLQALQQREGTYTDATTMPKNLMEMQNIMIKAKDEFYKMPIEVRKEFDNSPEKYIGLMGTKEFLDIMSPYNEKLEAISKEKSHKEYLQKVKDGAKLNIDIEREMAAMKGDEAKA